MDIPGLSPAYSNLCGDIESDCSPNIRGPAWAFLRAGDPDLREQLSSFYLPIRSAVTPALFSSDALEYGNSDKQFIELEIIATVPLRSRRMIMRDVPRTFSGFMKRSEELRRFLSQRDDGICVLCAVLCRVLCTAMKFFSMTYCQGMNFLCGFIITSYFCAEINLAQTRSVIVDEVSLEIDTAAAFCYMLSVDGLKDLYNAPTALPERLMLLDSELRKRSDTERIVSHLDSLGCTVHFYALEWLTTVPKFCCFRSYDCLHLFL
jgi:hypothetical protein